MREIKIITVVGARPQFIKAAPVHRAENTDDPARLNGILTAFERMGRPVILPLHPRTRKTLGAGLEKIGGQVRVIDPVPYLDMIILEKTARAILTDSGGVQKEAYWFDPPCVTLREETEWLELVEAGCNRLAGADPDGILSAVSDFEAAGAALPPDRPSDLYGDGRSADKIVEVLAAAEAHVPGREVH